MDPAVLRHDMVDGLTHEAKDVVRSDQIDAAMRTVPREPFVDGEADQAYLDRPSERLGTTVLAPSTVARLLEALGPDPDDRVLVVGAGVGYTVAVLAEIAGASRVQAVDISRDLVLEARGNLREAGYEGALVDRRDGSEGFPQYAPYDRILVEAAAVDPPAALVDQLASGGRLVFPRGVAEQELIAVEGGEPVGSFGPANFEPLLVDGEQPGAVERNRTAREERERAAREAASRPGWERDWIEWD